MTDDESLANLNLASKEIHGVASKRFVQWVFIGTYEHADDSRQTISNWGGDLNGAVGLSMRLNERMRQEIISTDYPSEPDSNDDWKTHPA